jgi:trigger factor
MQVSVEATSSIERRMTIGVPSDQIDQKVEARLQQAARTVKINGFRPGKVPVNVVRKRFGRSLRQEVVGEVMSESFSQALSEQGITPISYPRFEPKTLEAGRDLEFVAIFEVYPEVAVPDLGALELSRPEVEIKEKDVKNMVDVLRRTHGTLKSVKRKSKKKDVLTVDFVGYLGAEAFDGGTAKDQRITLGSGQMIPGFEDGLVGAKAGDKVELNVTFPDDYGNESLAGKEARFEVGVKTVEEVELPELNQEFFTKYGVSCETESEFEAEVQKNMERELEQAIMGRIKQQVVDQLVAANTVDVPASMLEQEIRRIKQEAVQQFGGARNLDPSMLPSELFKDRAEKRVKTGLLFAALIKANGLKADPARVDEKIGSMSESYEDPQELIAWYSKPENRAQVEHVVIEEKVVELALEQSKVKKVKMSYEDAVKPEAPGA